MKKFKKISYWIATIWLSLGMISTAIVQLMHIKEEVANFSNLGYPIYLMNLIGISKILGVIALLVPKFLILKEWAYAGFFFLMTGAIISHIVNNSPAISLFGPLLLLVLTILSWYLRPSGRFVNSVQSTQ